MKVFIPILLLIAVSCSQVSPRQDKELTKLESLLSAEDLAIHLCLAGEFRKECLKGTPYDGKLTRVPSSDDNEIILKNSWFFNSSETLHDFYDLSRGFLKAQTKLLQLNGQKLMNSKGISVEGSAYMGVGRSWAAEFMILENRLGLYCSPGYLLQSDIGVDLELSVVQALACPTHLSYRGKDISFSAGISGELVGLPVGLGAAYNLGVDLDVFKIQIEESKKKGQLSISGLRNDLTRLSDSGVRNALTNGQENALPLLALALRPLGIFQLQTPTLATNQAKLNFLRSVIRSNQSVGLLLRNFYNRQLGPRLRANKLTHLDSFFSVLSQTLSLCDSVGGAFSLGLSLSPVSLGVAYSRSEHLAEVGFNDLITFARITPLVLLNPFLLPPEDLRNIVKVARGVTSLPKKIQRNCSR
jgi:hypothetical protein